MIWLHLSDKCNNASFNNILQMSGKKRYLGVVREDVQIAGVREEDAIVRVRWRQVIRCCDPCNSIHAHHILEISQYSYDV